MKFINASIFLIVVLSIPWIAISQDKAVREIDLHENVKLIETAIPQDMPEELKARYERFLPVFEAALKESTSRQPQDNPITFRIVPGIKEIGSAKTKRAMARIVAYQRKSSSEYVGSLILHNYATGEIVTKQDIREFLTKQILRPMGVS